MKKTLAMLIAPFLMVTGMTLASDPVIVVIDNKLVKADKLVSPKVTLTGAEQPIPPGELVVIQANVEDEYPIYVKSKTFDWNVSEKGFLKRSWTEGPKVVFGAGMNPTTIIVDVKASFTYGVGGEDVILVKYNKVDVTIGTAPPPNPVPPNPVPPNPIPPTPPSLTGTAKFAYDSAMAKGPADKSSAPILAQGFTQTAAQIGHNPELTDPRVILTKTKEANNAALTQAGVNPTIWDPWGTALQDYLYAEYQAGRLKTPANYKTYWEDIAKGLNEVK